MSRALYVLGWVVVGVLGVFAVLRLVAWDAIELLAVVNALTMVVYLPAWLVALAGAVTRRWILAGAALVVVAAQLWYLAPELLAASPLPQWASDAPVVRLFDANVDKSLEFSSGYSSAIRRYRPDVVTLEEFTPRSLRHLRGSGAMRAYPFRCVAPRYGATGFLVMSRIPMSRCRVHDVVSNGQRTPYMVSAVLDTPGGMVTLRVVHTLAPFPSSWLEWQSALEDIDRAVRSGSSSRVLVVGDFNATWNNRGFAALLAEGMTDAAAARGDALDMTWPNGAVVPPFLRIDHILTGKDLAVTRLQVDAGYGSDHRFMTATIAIDATLRH